MAEAMPIVDSGPFTYVWDEWIEDKRTRGCVPDLQFEEWGVTPEIGQLIMIDGYILRVVEYDGYWCGWVVEPSQYG